MREKLTLERLKQVYLYNPETGEFIRLQAVNSYRGQAKVGDVAGSKSGERYVRIGIDGRVYRAHRLAWFYMTGEWPENGVDHKDLDPSNNRWSNLRAADQSQNSANTGRRKDNTSGFKGVYRLPNGTWHAAIHVRKRKITIGTFATPEEAFAAYRQAAEEHFGTFHRSS